MASLDGLDFILGRFRVVGRGGLAQLPASSESYTRADDSTIVMRAFRDSTFAQEVHRELLQVQGERLMYGHMVATSIARDSVRLEATRGDDRPLTLRREVQDKWIVAFSPRPGEAARSFEMQRIP